MSPITRGEGLFWKSKMSQALFQAYSLPLLSQPDEIPFTRQLACWMVGTETGLTFWRTGRIQVFQLWRSGRLLTALRIWLKPPTRMIKTMLSPSVISFHRKTSLSSSFQFFLRSYENSMTDFLTDSYKVDGISTLSCGQQIYYKINIVNQSKGYQLGLFILSFLYNCEEKFIQIALARIIWLFIIIDTKSMSWNDRDIIKQVVSAQGMSCEIAYYQQGNHIAKGGHSFCFQVRKFKGLTQQYLGEEAVLKIIDPKLKQKFLSVFENEVKVLRILNGQHCNRFSRYLTHWKCNKTQLCFILLEKCAFGSLLNFTQYVEQQGKTLTQLQIIFFLREILQAVQIMHNLKIIHRDLKLQNVLISSDLSVKLIDFGLSLVGQDQKQPLGTNMQGTPLYMSPQIVNGVDYSYEADIWAIGVILYYLMYFTFPFYGSSKAQVKDSVLSTDIKFQKKVEYKQLITICKSLLNRDKKMRPTVAQLLKQSIFQKLKKEADVQQRIYYKYQNYFNIKLRSYKWRERIIQEPIDLKVEVETMILNETQQQKRQRQSKFVQYVKRRSIKTQKVRIIHLIHNIKYGFFLLLSNLSLFAYFNNSKILRFYPSLLQRAQSNQQIILCCVYKKHFKEMMDKQYQEDLDVQFNEPNCSIAKVSLVNDNFFVRLTNNVLQVYLTKAAKAEDGSFIFTLQLQYNTNTVNYKQITVLSRDGKVNTYSDYQQASKSFHGKYVNYVKDIFEIILDNSCISFQQLQLKRKS